MGRINGFDALRAIAMWLGVVLHALIVYKSVPEPNWPHDDSFNSEFLDWLYQYIHVFRMPLFFLVAGFFARLVITRSGIKYFRIQRKKRIFYISCIVLNINHLNNEKSRQNNREILLNFSCQEINIL